MITKFDVIIIGGGASGLMASITTSSGNKSTLVLESENKPGKKLLATGGGRCNFTHYGTIDNIAAAYNNPNFIKPSLHEFSPDKVIEFFKENGIQSSIEDNNCVFPESNKASDILNALYDLSLKNGTIFKLDSRV